MRKNGGILVLFILIFIIFISVKYTGTSTIVQCFRESGAELVRIDTEGSARIDTSDSCRAVAERLFTSSGMEGVFSIEESGDTVELRCEAKGLTIYLKCKKILNKNSVYAFFNLSQYSADGNIINNIRGTIAKAFSTYNVKPSFSSLIQGKYKREISMSDMKDITQGLLRSFGACYINGVDVGNVVSISGYVPSIGDTVSYMGKKANMNIALRYSKTNGCTYIWIGCPLIMREY